MQPNHHPAPSGSNPEDVGTVTTDGGFTMLPDWLLEHPSLSDRALRVWLILMSYARSKDAKVAFLGRKRLADRCRCSVDSIDRAMKELRDAGALSITARKRDSDGAQTSNNYHLHTQPHQCGSPSAWVRPPLPTGAAPREKALERDLISPLSRLLPGKGTGTATTIDADWKPNHTHHVVARDLGLDITEMAEEFDSTYAVVFETRTDWDKTFTAFMRDWADGSYWNTA